MSLLENLILPFQFSFMVNAMVISLILAVPTGLLSCYLVLKGWSLMGDAVSARGAARRVVIAYIVGNMPPARRRLRRWHGVRARDGLSDGEQPGQAGHGDGGGLLGHVRAGHRALHQDRVGSVHLDHILFGDMLGDRARRDHHGQAALIALLVVSAASSRSSGATCCCMPSIRRRPGRWRGCRCAMHALRAAGASCR